MLSHAFTLALAASSLVPGTAASFSSPSSRAKCLDARSDELASLAACGHEGSIASCLSDRLDASSQPEAASLTALVEKCLVSAGCTAEEAAIEAQWTLKRCAGGSEDRIEDLRRRQKKRQDSSASTEETTATSATPASTLVTTTSATPASTSATTTSSSSVPSTSAGSSKRQAASTTAAAAATSTSLVCFTTRTVSTTTCPIQSTGVSSGKVMDCTSTMATVEGCAPGLLCSTSNTGGIVCMKKRKMDTGGIIIAIVFAGLVALGASLILFFCCREKRHYAKLAKEAEAAALAKQAAVDKKRASPAVRSVSAQSAPGSDSVPLMRADEYGGSDNAPVPPMPTSQSNNHVGPNPFVDQRY